MKKQTIYTDRHIRRKAKELYESDPEIGYCEAEAKLRRNGLRFASTRFRKIWTAVTSNGEPVKEDPWGDDIADEFAEAMTSGFENPSELSAWLDMGRELFGGVKFEVRLLP